MKHEFSSEAVVIVVGVFLVSLGEFVRDVESASVCNLKYSGRQSIYDDLEPPNLLVMTNNVPGVCGFLGRHPDPTTPLNYHQEHKYVEQIRPESVLGGLGYDARDDLLIYWSKIANVDHARLYRVRLNDSDWQPVLDQDDDFRDVAYDWIGKNVYVIMGGERNVVVVVSAQHRWNPTVILQDRSRLTSLAVHPNRGYMFFSEASYAHGPRYRLYRANLDGGEVRELLATRPAKEARYYVDGLTVDFHADRLYWSVPGGRGKIQHSDLDGRDVRTIKGVAVHSGQLDLTSKVLAVDARHVYYRAAEGEAVVRRLVKASGRRDEDFEVTAVKVGRDGDAEQTVITEIMAYDAEGGNAGGQRVRMDHPCREARGGCQKYCMAVPRTEAEEREAKAEGGEAASGRQGGRLKRVCKCSFNDVLGADGKSCAARSRHGVGR